MKTIDIASDVVTGSATFAGLILVYIGSVSTAFAAYTKTEQRTVAAKFRRRAVIASVGVCLGAASAGCALLGKWATSRGAVGLSAILFCLTLAWGTGAAYEMVREIR